MASANVIELTEANWEKEVVQSDQPVLVDFWAVWCGPCRALAPTIDKIADSYVGRVKVGKVNTDQAQALAVRFGISAIPQIMIFKGSAQPVERPSPGVKSAEEISRMLDRVLGSATA